MYAISYYTGGIDVSEIIDKTSKTNMSNTLLSKSFV